MTFEHAVSLTGVVFAFAGLCVTLYKIRQSDWREINNQIQACILDLAAFKITVTEKHPTIADLAAAERRFIEANRETLDAINRLSDRIDRLLEAKR